MNQQQLENCTTLHQDVKKIRQKEQLSLIMTHNDFKDDDGKFFELYAVKKHFKVETEGDPDYFFDEVATDDNEQPVEEVLPQVIDDEVMGVNDRNPQNLAAALNGGWILITTMSKPQKMFQDLESSLIQCCLWNGVMWAYVINDSKAIQIERPYCQILLTSLGTTSTSSCLRGSFPNTLSMM